MKHRISKIIITSILATSIGLGFTFAFSKHNQKTALPVEAESVESYYSSISDSLTGNSLLTALNTLNNQKRKKTVGYAGMRSFAAYSDADPDGSGKIIGFYDNKKVGPDWDGGSSWNREHVWPNVRGGSNVEADAHMTRPASTQTNSDRGSRGFGKESYDPGKYVAYYRGVASRIIFYAAIADTSLKIVDFPFNYDGVGGGNSGYPANSMGCLSDMLEWNLQYKPSDTSFTGGDDLARRTELNRNNVIQNHSSGQGNRNPFIDHPEYACKIWGNTNDKTRQICKMDAPTGTTVSLSKTSHEMKIGESTTITATSSESDSLTWTTNNDNITLSKTTTNSGESISFTANKAGSTTITVRNTFDGVATCNVTVNAITGTEVYLTYDEYTLNVGESFSLCAGSTENDEITWTTDNDNVVLSSSTSASFVDINVTAVKAGETILTANNTFDGVATCKITIKNGGDSSSSSESGSSEYEEPSSQEPKDSSEEGSEQPEKKKSGLGCGGYIAASSVAIFMTSLMGIIYFVRKRKQ